MRGISTALGVLLMSMGATSAVAEWLHTTKDDPFEKSTEHYVIANGDSGLVGFRCTNAEDATLMFIASQRLSEQMAAQMSTLPAKLLVVIDDASPIVLEAALTATENRNIKASAMGPAVVDLYAATAAAKRRIAIAIEFMGEKANRIIASTAGSRGPLEKAVKGCKLQKTS